MRFSFKTRKTLLFYSDFILLKKITDRKATIKITKKFKFDNENFSRDNLKNANVLILLTLCVNIINTNIMCECYYFFFF